MIKYRKGVIMGENKENNWFKKHADTLVILGAFASALIWMNGKFSDLEKDLAVVKTVLIMKNIMPIELAKVGDSE
jgi:hypothetical protein